MSIPISQFETTSFDKLSQYIALKISFVSPKTQHYMLMEEKPVGLDGQMVCWCKKVGKLDNNINQQNLVDIYRTVHPTRAEIFVRAHRTCYMIDHIMSHKTKIILNKF